MILPAFNKIALALALVVAQAFPTFAQDDWEPYPEKVDMLAVITHPDDEGAFWAGMLAYYATCQEKKVVLISLTSGEWGNGLPHPIEEGEEVDCSYNDEFAPCCDAIPEEELFYPNYYRETELGCAAKNYGIKYKPVMDRLFKDMDSLQPEGEAEGCFELWGGKEKVVKYMAEQIRRFKPDVLVTLDWHGGNGNPQHAASAQGSVYAAQITGDESKYPEQVEKYGAWQPKKVYMHVPEKDFVKYGALHPHSWIDTCEGDPTTTAQALGAKAAACHYCQDFAEACAESTMFRLVDTTVGPDIISHDNLFEHIE